MRVAFVKHTKEKVGLIDMDVDYYKATVTQEGSNKAQPCTATYGNRGKDEIPVSRYARIITCSAALKEYAFDLETNRFMVDYLVGYLGGKDDNSDTPAISIGTCTKIPQ
jgi:hypothetical protein